MLQGLRDEQDALWFALISLRQDRGDARDQRELAEAHLVELNGKRPSYKDEPAHVVAQREHIERLKKHIGGIDQKIAHKDSAHAAITGLLQQTVYPWLEKITGLAPVSNDPPPRLPSAISPATLDDIRNVIAELRADLHDVLSAPRDAAEVKKLASELITGMSARGAPNINSLLDGIPEIQFPMQYKSELTNTKSMMVHVEQPMVKEILCWLHHDAMIARLNEEIDASVDPETTITEKERQEKVTALSASLLEQERLEEAIIEALPAGTLRRPDADPRAVFGLSSKLPAPERN